jgi:sugar/nucleoside kinase (ribokinase family)
VALTLSDAFVIDRYGDDFRALLAEGLLDILFCNEAELGAMIGSENFEAGVAALAPQVPVLVVTRGAGGAIALAGGERAEVPAEPVAAVVDTTGAGDLFAAGFLAGHVRARPLADCLTMGAVAAAEVISHYGARPEADLQALIASRLG